MLELTLVFFGAVGALLAWLMVTSFLDFLEIILSDSKTVDTLLTSGMLAATLLVRFVRHHL